MQIDACGPPHPEKHFDTEYVLGPELGKGNYSVVRIATHRTTAVNHAVKIVKRASLPPEDEEAILMEVRLLLLLLLCVTLLFTFK